MACMVHSSAVNCCVHAAFLQEMLLTVSLYSKLAPLHGPSFRAETFSTRTYMLYWLSATTDTAVYPIWSADVHKRPPSVHSEYGCEEGLF